MAGALRSCAGINDDKTISFLVVANDVLCERIAEGLLRISRARHLRSVVHQCESIVDVLRLRPDFTVDYIVFTFDWRLSHSISEIEESIGLVDEHYIISGRACLINCVGVPKPISGNFSRAKSISEKFNLHLITVNINLPNSPLDLAKRILNLSESTVGTKIGFPILPRPPQTEN